MRTIGAAFTLLAAAGIVSPVPAQEHRQQHARAAGTFDARRWEARVPEIPPGTAIPVTLDEDIPVSRDNLGDTFEGHITRDVEVNGEVVLVGGAPVEVKLVEHEGSDESATLELTRVHVNGDMRRVSAGEAKADADKSGLSTAEKTGVGAAAGAIVGAVTGAGVLEGAIVGAGGGLAWGLLDGDRARVVDDDSRLRFELEEELELD